MSTKRVSQVEESSTLVVQEDPVTGDLFIELPQRLLKQLGWNEGDDLQWIQDANGNWTVKKVEEDEAEDE
jgi:hypothetical protein